VLKGWFKASTVRVEIGIVFTESDMELWHWVMSPQKIHLCCAFHNSKRKN